MKKEKILIGWGMRDVTPQGKVSLRGQFYVRITDEVHDSLTTTALAIESAVTKEQTIMVSLDAVSVTDELIQGCRRLLAEQIPDFNVDKLVINATHTHTAPEQYPLPFWPDMPGLGSDIISGKEYGDFLVKKITEAAVEAWQKRSYGGLSWGKGYAVVGFNRRMSYFDGSTVMYGKVDVPEFSHVEGYEDHSVNMLFTYDQEKKLTGMVVNVPCPSQCTEGSCFISADYWHETRLEIRQHHGDEIFILPQCSAAGDQSPHILLNREADRRMMELKGYGADFQTARRKDIAEKITAAVNEVLPLLTDEIHYEIEFGHIISKLSLPERKATENDLEFARQEVAAWQAELEKLKGADPASREYSTAFRRLYFNKNVISMYERQQQGENSMPVELHIFRLGDIAMCTNRFEYYLDFGERIKGRSKALQTFIVQLAGAGSYLPTERSLAGGSYGAYIASTPIGPEGGQIIVEESLKAINRMFEN